MPPYCKTCPYNKYCENTHISEAICPMGYVPKSGAKPKKRGRKTEEEPLDPGILLLIGRSYNSEGEYELALKCFNKVLELGPDNQETQFLKKRTEYILSQVSGKIELEDKPITEYDDDGSPLTLPSEPSIKVGHSKAIYYDSVRKVPLKGKKVLTVKDSDKEKKGISKAISIRTHGSILKKRGTEVVIGVVIAFLVLLVILLFLTGHLRL
jgi:tetratricopeptide (TPR) repeat protein